MTNTPNLNLPYLLAAQSQKHVTHNEALRALDAVVQMTVLDRNLATPPVTPVEGDRYIVAASPAGAWAGQANTIAAYQDAAWLFYPPKEGWITWIADENIAVAFDGAAWTTLSGGGGGVTAHSALTGLAADDHPQYHNNARGDVRYTPINPATLGVNATADATNKFAVSSAASLFNHVGTGGHQIKINKAAVTDTASFLFQTAFSGRAEIGLTGDDDFHFKVSPNGTTFNEAILINKTTGACTFPNSSFGGEVNTASNVGTAGVGLFKQKTGVNLELKKINAGSTKVTITDDTVNSEVDVDVVEANLTLANIGGTIDLGGVKASGTIAAARMPAHTGDVTSTAGNVALTIAANAVTNAKAAQMAATTLKGNNTGVAANAADLTAAQVKTVLAITNADVSGLGALATAASVNLTTQATGTLQAAQAPAHTGDVTTEAGSLATALATVNGNVGSFGLAASVSQLTVNAKGLITAAANVAIAVASTAITDATTAGRAMLTAATAAAQTALLAVFVGDTGSGGTKGLVPAPATGDATKFLRGDGAFVAIPGGGDALVASPLSQFAATTSAQLAGVLTDETGTGSAVFATSPTLITPVLGAASATSLALSTALSIANGGTGATTAAAAFTGLSTAQPTVQTFAASGTWTKPAGVKRVRVRAIGGGGGGGGATAAASASCCGGGGGSGSYGEGVYDVTATATVVVTVGAAGAAGAAANGTGGTGGATSFGALLTAPGGLGGVGMTSGTAVAFTLGGASGVAGSGGSINSLGHGGGFGTRLSATILMPGQGGVSPFGGAQRPSTASAAGIAGVTVGVGGSGAASSSATGFAGGAGAAGLIIVEEFY